MKKKKNEIRLFCEFVIPPMLIWALIVVVPLIYGIYLTFTDWNGLSPDYNLVGFANYVATFTDKTFLTSLLKTFVYVFFVVVLSNVLGLALALLLTYGIKLQGLFRTCFFAANMIGGVVMGYIWNYIFSFALTKVGEVTGIGLFETSWLTNPTMAMVALIVVAVWQLSGYLMVIYVAGLTNVSKEMLEAAQIDGTTPWQLLRYIKIPMIRSSVTICVFMAISRAFMAFDVNLTLTAGGPFKSTELLALKIYQTAFSNFDYGKGQAEALVLFVIVAIISLVQVSVSKKGEVQA
ncbi:MAG: sugar ABC transporter permease [Eubacteriales bacterium]|nr:sugar ABC transporter permease [Eubacteriales bacterium]